MIWQPPRWIGAARLTCALGLISSVLISSTLAQSNVIVILSDDAGWADFGFMRDADSRADPGAAGAIPTPNLDALASRGVTFTNAYAGSVCSVFRAMITTGEYTPQYGYSSNISTSSDRIGSTRR